MKKFLISFEGFNNSNSNFEFEQVTIFAKSKKKAIELLNYSHNNIKVFKVKKVTEKPINIFRKVA